MRTSCSEDGGSSARRWRSCLAVSCFIIGGCHASTGPAASTGRAGFESPRNRSLPMPKLTLRYVVAAVREALTADGNWNGERLWQGRTDNELLLVVEGAKKRPGGWLLRWQYIDAVGELQQYRLDVLTTAELQAALVVVKQHAELAVPFGNPFPDLGEKSAKDPLLELVKRLAHEHKNVEDEK